MTAYLVILYFVVLGGDGKPLMAEASRELARFSTPEACGTYADKKALELRAKAPVPADTTWRCVAVKEQP